MKQKTTSRLMHGSVIMSIIFGMMACNGSDSSDKTANDSLTTTATAAKATDSATRVKATKKKKGQMSTYINKNLTYPQAAIDNGTSGTVRVTFVVDEDGKVINPQAIDGKNLGDDIVNQTLKVFSNMPMWTPGMVHNKKVKARLEVPVTFQLADADQ